ncbi:TIGR03503 family protein [uncultured Psychrosphaera sp.]|uniref:TIGR03503 family protein n=1 Tax=uncultured Psychrosphaera sp. TaxID=1403522 RepID=UPI0026334613|nr:TIGR03503 family protein [uncultured Psychrosphaera sp.]
MAKHSVIYAFVVLLFVGTLPSFAAIDLVSPVSTVNTPKLNFIKNYAGKNQIRILNNRFRVDHHVDEVMLLFFRKHGSKPIILIQPDGSKIYPRDANDKTIVWHADLGYDLIKIKKPMPGPWQAVGNILTDSKIIILTDIELQADSFPETVFQYEVIKAEARVINGSEAIKAKMFHEVITLRANLYPTQDPTKDNFGTSIFQLGEFLDDGKGLDEKPRDGVFTIKYTINTEHGEWIPNYRINAELFSRELIQEPITVIDSPVSFTVIPAKANESGEIDRYHNFVFTVDDTNIDNLSLLFQGTIRFPNRDTQTFSIEGMQERRIEIFNGEYGLFTVDMHVFGTTKEGREFQLDIPPYQFVTEEPAIDYIELPEMTDALTDDKKEDEFSGYKPEPEPEIPVGFIVFMNILILLFGCLVIWLFVLKRDITNPFAGMFKKKDKDKQTSDTEFETEEQPQAEELDNKPDGDDSPDDILDLSLPED